MKLCMACHEYRLKHLCKELHFPTRQGTCEFCGKEDTLLPCTMPPAEVEKVRNWTESKSDSLHQPCEAEAVFTPHHTPENKEAVPSMGDGAPPHSSSPDCEATPDECGQEKTMEPENTNTEKEQDEAVDLSTLQGIPFSEGGQKPTFSTITRMKVKDAVLKHGRNDSKTEDGKDKYDALYLQVVFEAPGDIEFWENYGGIRLYHHKDPAPGKPEVTLWTGKDSYGAQLRNLMRDTYGEEVYNDITQMVEKLKASEVGVKTETTKGFSGGESTKNAIKQVYPVAEQAHIQAPAQEE